MLRYFKPFPAAAMLQTQAPC